jgi:gluconokinase
MSLSDAHILTADLGTSSLRVSLVSPALKIRRQSKGAITLDTGPDGKAEQDAEAILQKAQEAIREVAVWARKAGLAVDALCFSNTMASLIPLDASFRPLRPALTYADTRAGQEVTHLAQEYGRAFFCPTGAPLHASYWLPKLLWLKNNGLALDQVPHFCTIKDLLVHRLTGRFITDNANAVSTGMCDAQKGDWDPRLLEIAGLSTEQLPEIHLTTTVLDPLPAAGLPAGMKIVLGAMDGMLSSLGAGAFRPGQVTTMIGSSGAVRLAARSPLTDERAIRIWSYPLDDTIWMRGGAMNSGGLVTRWLAETLTDSGESGDSAYAALMESAARVPPGAEGLLFLPYLFGERSPIYDENARGVYFGLHSGHHRGHLARAGIEGILFALYSMFEPIRPKDTEEVEIRATGGYLRSELMLQIQADLFGLPIRVLADYEGSTIGAAVLARKALGQIASYDALSDAFRIETEFLPDPERTARYRESYTAFRTLYRQLQPLFG